MKHEIYNAMKKIINNEANQLGTDKGYRRYALNTLLDYFIRELNNYVLKGKFSEKMANIYASWLTNVVINRHDK